MARSTIKIEPNVPLPESLTRRSWPFADMKIGDSFYTPQAYEARSAASYWAKRHEDFRFSTRKEGDGIRVWRVKAED